MKVLVYPHDLSIGGSQLNAIELAAAVRALGVETVIYGRSGPLNERIEKLGLEFIEAPKARRRPSPASMKILRDIAHDRQINIFHGYEWPPSLECFLVATASRTHAISTTMSMAVAPFLPRQMPLVVGTRQIAETQRDLGRQGVSVIEPPVDLAQNSPAADIGTDLFKRRWHLDDRILNIVTVTRLGRELKLEGLLTLVSSIPRYEPISPLRLLIVGDGPARVEISARADQINRLLRRDAVVLIGSMADPRAAYASADIAVGMGGSALRALAFAKPLIVQGENGFWSLLTPSSVDDFLWAGWYGVGPGHQYGTEMLDAALKPILFDTDLRQRLAAFGADVVLRFSLEEAATRQVEIYERTLADTNASALTLENAHAAARYVHYAMHRKVLRARRLAATDDFNSQPVAADKRLPKL